MPKPSDTCPKCDRYSGGGLCGKCSDLGNALLPPEPQAEQIKPRWPAAYAAHRIKGQPVGPFLFKGAQTLPDNVSPEMLETEIYVPESALQAEAKARDEAEEALAQRDEELRERLTVAIASLAARRKKGIDREFDKSADPEDRYAGHGEAEAYETAIKVVRAALVSIFEEAGASGTD